MRNVKNDIVKVENYLIYDIITSWNKVIFRIKNVTENMWTKIKNDYIK